VVSSKRLSFLPEKVNLSIFFLYLSMFFCFAAEIEPALWLAGWKNTAEEAKDAGAKL